MVSRQRSFGSENGFIITASPTSSTIQTAAASDGNGPQHHTILVDSSPELWSSKEIKYCADLPLNSNSHQLISSASSSSTSSTCGSTCSESSSTSSSFKLVFTARKRKSAPAVYTVVCWTLIAFGFIGYYYLHHFCLPALADRASVSLGTNHELKIRFRSTEMNVRMLARDLKYAEKKKAQVFSQPQSTPPQLEQAELELEQAELILRTTNDEKTLLEKTVQQHSYQMATQKFGSAGSSYQVEFILQFPSGEDKKFTIEMAPLQEMPHFNQVFLDMASNGLWDGCSFVMNAMHVLKTAPLPYDGSGKSSKDLTQAFTDAGLSGSPSFPEIHPDHPHSKYTVGFTLNTGNGPSFFINTDDNSEMYKAEASAFAKVVDGFDTLDALLNYPTSNGIWLQDRIGIKSARVQIL